MLPASGFGDFLMPTNSPRWSKASSQYRDSCTEAFKRMLSSVASAFAYHASLDSVSASHVDEAYRAIARSALSRRSRLRSPEFIASLGALLVGISFSLLAVFLRLVADEWKGLAWVVWALVFVVGAVIWLWGWLSKPSIPKPTIRLKRWRHCWPFLQCPRADEFSIF